MNLKLAYNITFHHQLDSLEFHIDNLMKWSISDKIKFVLTSAHDSNLKAIAKYIQSKKYSKQFYSLFVTPDWGYNRGTVVNVCTGLDFIRKNLEYDYVVNVEADNMFYFEHKLLSIIDEMVTKNKHMLIIPEGDTQETNIGNDILGLRGLKTGRHLSNEIPKYHHFTTLNIFSKKFLEENFPFEHYDEFANFSWAGRRGTPYEDYMGLAIIKKNNLTEESQLDFYKTCGLKLDYDVTYTPYGWNEPDNMVPDKFIKWGIVNSPSTAGGSLDADRMRVKQFIDLHTPLCKNI